MAIFDNIRLALSSLWAGKMRALLTMLGIIIGIGSVIAIMTVGDSLTGSLTDSMSSFGVNNITVSVTEKTEENTSDWGGGMLFGSASSNPAEKDRMTDAMIQEYQLALGSHISSISLTHSVGNATVRNRADSATATVSGVNPDYQLGNNIEMLTGRFISDDDLANERKVCVVSDKLAEKVYGSVADAMGQGIQLSIGGGAIKAYVVGVYKYEASAFSFSGGSSSDVVSALYLPVTTAKTYSGAGDGYSSFTVATLPDTDNAAFMNATTAFFSSFYTRNETYTVEASSMEQMMSTLTEMLGTVQIAIMAIAAISLLVGGIGVMNIMLVSITERTREIGTRIALGAPKSAIRLQFITESVIICVIGGAIGILLGVGLGALASGLLGYAARPSVGVIAVAVLFSMGIGIFFGYYPANKAAKLDPIEALRYE